MPAWRPWSAGPGGSPLRGSGSPSMRFRPRTIGPAGSTRVSEKTVAAPRAASGRRIGQTTSRQARAGEAPHRPGRLEPCGLDPSERRPRSPGPPPARPRPGPPRPAPTHPREALGRPAQEGPGREPLPAPRPAHHQQDARRDQERAGGRSAASPGRPAGPDPRTAGNPPHDPARPPGSTIPRRPARPRPRYCGHIRGRRDREIASARGNAESRTDPSGPRSSTAENTGASKKRARARSEPRPRIRPSPRSQFIPILSDLGSSGTLDATVLQHMGSPKLRDTRRAHGSQCSRHTPRQTRRSIRCPRADRSAMRPPPALVAARRRAGLGLRQEATGRVPRGGRDGRVHQRRDPPGDGRGLPGLRLDLTRGRDGPDRDLGTMCRPARNSSIIEGSRAGLPARPKPSKGRSSWAWGPA